jgi:hypothetical protein
MKAVVAPRVAGLADGKVWGGRRTRSRDVLVLHGCLAGSELLGRLSIEAAFRNRVRAQTEMTHATVKGGARDPCIRFPGAKRQH